MPSSSSSCRMTKYMSAQPTMKPSTIPISSLEQILTRLYEEITLIPCPFFHRAGRAPCSRP